MQFLRMLFGRVNDEAIYVRSHWIFTSRSSGVVAYGRRNF